MSRLRSYLPLLLLPALMSPLAAVRAADLGPILLTSPAGQPLQGLVSLSLGAEETLGELAVAVGSPAEYGWLEITRPSWIDNVEVHVTDEDGEPRVRLWTTDPPPDRRFSLLLVVSSPAGRGLRQYDVQLRDAEVLLAPAEPQANAAEIAAKRPGGGAGADPAVSGSESAPVARPSRRTGQVPERADAEVRRNLSISSASTRPQASALERRAQRLEEDAAAQRRALNEANTRISDLQGQVEKLEKLLALKGVSPLAEKAVPAPTAAEPAKAAAAAAAKPSDTATKPAAAAEKAADTAAASKPAADAAPAPAAPAPADATAQPAPPASAAAPMVEVDPAAEPAPAPDAVQPQPAEAAKKPAEGEKADHAADEAEQDDGLTGLLLTVGGVVLALALATLGAFWWRRRRAEKAKLAEAMAAAAAPAAAEGGEADAQAAAEPVADAAPAEEVAAEPAAEVPEAATIEAVDASIAQALDAPMGDATPVEAAPPADAPVASLAAVTAEPVEAAGADDLDAMFSEEAIAAAQAAIQATAAAEPEPAAEAPAESPAAEAAAEPVENPAAEATDTDEDADEGDNEADLEDVEVNLAKAYIDMGDPDGARAILEGMMSDPDDPDRAALARRTMRRFGMRPGAPPAEAAATEG